MTLPTNYANNAYRLPFKSAEECDYFISTDDRLLKHQDDRIELINPVDFIRLWREKNNDE
jgi:hypothetical protein